jgi:hypothetical protein
VEPTGEPFRLSTARSIVNRIDHMVNSNSTEQQLVSPALSRLIFSYIFVVILTVVALAIFSVVAPAEATPDAWGHAIVVAIFAVVLPLRLRAARRGSRRALTAVGIIAIVLVVVNVVEALIPNFVPVWMRAEMGGIAVLTVFIAAFAFRPSR